MKWSAVITAGGVAPPELAKSMGVPQKALAVIAGETCIARVVGAITRAGVEEIVVVGDEPIRAHLPERVKLVSPKHNPAASARAGFEVLINPQAILFIPADTPLLTAEQLREFSQISESRINANAWLSIGLCRLDDFRKTGAPHKALKIRDYPCVSTSLMAGSASGFSQSMDQLERASKNRKSQLKIALSAGPINLLRYFTGLLTLSGAEKTASRIFGGQAILIKDCHPHTAMDIDDVADWNHLQEYVKKLGLE